MSPSWPGQGETVAVSRVFSPFWTVFGLAFSVRSFGAGGGTGAVALQVLVPVSQETGGPNVSRIAP